MAYGGETLHLVAWVTLWLCINVSTVSPQGIPVS